MKSIILKYVMIIQVELQSFMKKVNTLVIMDILIEVVTLLKLGIDYLIKRATILKWGLPMKQVRELDCCFARSSLI